MCDGQYGRLCEGEGGREGGGWWWRWYALEDLEYLVNLRIAGEQGLSRAHLGEDAADRPHVDAGRVLPAAQEDLGGAVPERHHLGVSISHLIRSQQGEFEGLDTSCV